MRTREELDNELFDAERDFFRACLTRKGRKGKVSKAKAAIRRAEREIDRVEAR